MNPEKSYRDLSGVIKKIYFDTLSLRFMVKINRESQDKNQYYIMEESEDSYKLVSKHTYIEKLKKHCEYQDIPLHIGKINGFAYEMLCIDQTVSDEEFDDCELSPDPVYSSISLPMTVSLVSSQQPS